MSQSKKIAVEKVPTTSAPLTTTPSNPAKPSGYADFLLEVKASVSGKPKLKSLIEEISWAKNLLIMARAKDDLEREFYQ
jgi:hypothetical protein